MSFLVRFKKQNWGIKIGYISLVVSFIALALGLILIGVAHFIPKNSNYVSSNLIGNGFEVISKNGISIFLTSQGYEQFKIDYAAGNEFISAPLVQLIIGIVFLIIIFPTFAIITVLALIAGYFKRWLYT